MKIFGKKDHVIKKVLIIPQFRSVRKIQQNCTFEDVNFRLWDEFAIQKVNDRLPAHMSPLRNGLGRFTLLPAR